MKIETIVYSVEFGDYSHNGDVIFDLEKFIEVTLKMGNSVEFELERDSQQSVDDMELFAMSKINEEG